MNMARKTLASTGVAVVLGLALGLIVSSSDGHACHLGEHHKTGEPCGGDDGGGGDVADNNTTAQWSDVDSDISELAGRGCVLETDAPNGNAGHYICDMPDQSVTFNLTGGTEFNKRGRLVDPQTGICDEFNDDLEMTPRSSYLYGWEGLCTSGAGCDIRVANWFFEDPFRPRPDETGLIIVEGFGEVAETSNLNPFADSHTISIDEIVITIKGNGTNKTVAICQYDTTTDPVSFESDPAP